MTKEREDKQEMLFGGLEAGGTKMVCAIGKEDGTLIDRVSIPTGSPEETIPELIRYFKEKEVQALGIGCFGPLDLNRSSETYGSITNTPKEDWAGVNIAQRMKEALSIPVGIDTDVNAAVLGEVVYGVAKGCSSAIYMTVGTGVGVGISMNGGLVHGLVHPEAGHMMICRDQADTFRGCCPFHSNCVEGLASGKALEKRYGRKAQELSDRADVWELESDYLAQAVANYILVYSPEKVILWGGVMHQKKLLPMVRKKVQKLLNGYVSHPLLTERIEEYIVYPLLGENPGIMGSIYLGMKERKRGTCLATQDKNVF